MFVAAGKPYPSDIRTLTSLRFYAAMAIVLFHFTSLLPFDANARTDFFLKCHLGVDFFFILSGFVLMHVYQEIFSKDTGAALPFYIRRLARIYPLHLATFFLCAALDILFWFWGWRPLPTYFSPNSVVGNLLLLQSLGVMPGHTFNAPSWSISAEWFAYLAFPFLALKLATTDERKGLIGSLAIFLAFWVSLEIWGTRSLTTRTIDYGVLRIFPEFIAGMALNRFGRVYALKWRGRILLPLCVGTIAILSHFNAPDILIVLVFFAVIFAAAEQARNGTEGWLARPLPVYLGEISYAIYMTHYLALMYVLEYPLRAIYGSTVSFNVYYTCFFILFPLTLGLSVFLYHYVEKPCRAWGRHFALARSFQSDGGLTKPP